MTRRRPAQQPAWVLRRGDVADHTWAGVGWLQARWRATEGEIVESKGDKDQEAAEVVTKPTCGTVVLQLGGTCRCFPLF